MEQKIQENKKQEVIDQLKEIAPKFAKKVVPIYDLLNWTWWRCNPNYEDVLSVITYLISEIEKPDTFRVSTGGLTIEIKNDEENSTLVGVLKMEISEYCSTT